MLSATIGAASAGFPLRGAEAKPALPEQRFENAAAPEETATAPSATTTPTIPATNGAQISVEAVTALQQVDAEAAVNEQRGAVASSQGNDENAVVELGTQTDEGDGVEAAAVQVQELEEEAVQSRNSDAEEVPVGEETDAAGRSVRNPLNLQI